MQRITTGPADLVGRWFVVPDGDGDTDVKFYDDAEFASDKLEAKREAEDPVLASAGRLIVAGIDEYRVGDVLELADRDTVDAEFSSRAGKPLRHFVIALLFVGGNILLDVVGQPLRHDRPWWLGAVNMAVFLGSILAVTHLGFWWLTRDPDSRATRALAGRFRAQSLDGHRAELES